MPKGGLRSTSWNKGESGNIAGRPKRPEAIEAKKIVADVKAAAREHTQDALDTLKAVMSDAKAPSAARVSAATAMLDRGWSNSDRPCGHSSLVCAVDAQIAVKRDASENIVATLALKKRGSRRGNRQPARSSRGRQDEDGEPIRSMHHRRSRRVPTVEGGQAVKIPKAAQTT